MARWRLTASHYLHTPDSRWEYSEISRTTGKPLRQQFKVPALLNIDDPSLWTEKILGMDGKPVAGSIIVCLEGRGQPGDQVIEGDPTPDMEPLDDEARALSEAKSAGWIHPIESLPGQGFAESVIAGFQRQIADLQAGRKPAENEQLAEIVKQNAVLIDHLVKSPRRV